MPSMRVSVPHSLGSGDVAREKLQAYVQIVRSQYEHRVSNVREQWQGNLLEFGFSAMGMSTSGKVEFADGFVHIESQIPLVALPLRGKIEEQIREQIGRALA